MEERELDQFREMLEKQLEDLSNEAGLDLKALRDADPDQREIDFVDSASDDEHKKHAVSHDGQREQTNQKNSGCP